MLASKTFEWADQVRFAAMTGDCNPMHMDPVAARRTSAGAPVVHGIHTLLWMLDMLAAHHPEVAAMTSLKVRFGKMVYPGDRVDAELTQLTSAALRARAFVDGVEVVQLSAQLGAAASGRQLPASVPALALPQQTQAQAVAMEDLQGRTGRLSFASPPETIAVAFPHAAKLFGARRVAALGCSTYLVGMIAPGLHSIYGALELNLSADIDLADELCYAVTSVDARFRRVQIEVWGGGVAGSLLTFSRLPPVEQPSMMHVAAQVARTEFDGAVVLIVGGSRGLGEITAKVIAAGGGHVIVTYVSGRKDAEALAREINAWGGRCDVLAYDVRQDAQRQLAALPQPATHLYYFATPTIFRRKAALCVRERLTEFNDFYVHGFLQMVEAGRSLRPSGIVAFYPSTVYVQERPADMTEYAMSKAAGEILCGEINRYVKGVRVVMHRLPRVATDQTASLVPVKSADPLEVMLPLVRDVQSAAASPTRIT